MATKRAVDADRPRRNFLARNIRVTPLHLIVALLLLLVPPAYFLTFAATRPAAAATIPFSPSTTHRQGAAAATPVSPSTAYRQPNSIFTAARDATEAHKPPHFPAECAALLENQTKNTGCHRNWDDPKCVVGGATTFQGQFNQDYYLYQTHFRHLPSQRDGVFLDVASADPIVLSNTWFFEECLGWRGMCVDANPEYLRRLRALRSCDIVPTCVGEHEGETVTFMLYEGLSGVQSTNKNDASRVPWTGNRTITCTTLRTQLGLRDIRHAHYMSLDVEGHELHALRGMDWTRIAIDVISVEVRPTSLPDIEAFLKGKGFVRHFANLTDVAVTGEGLLGEDVLFVHEDVTLGKPAERRERLLGKGA